MLRCCSSIAVALVLLMSVTAASAQATEPSTGEWSGNFWTRGLQGDVTSFAEDADGNLYVAGYFFSLDGDSVSGVVMWDGSEWTDIGDGIGTPNDLAIDNEGRLVAVGGIIRGDPLSSAVRWDGEGWTSLLLDVSVESPFVGSLDSGSASAVVVTPDGAIVVLILSSVSGRVVSWDGIEWTTLEDLGGVIGGNHLVETPDGFLIVDRDGRFNPDAEPSFSYDRFVTSYVVDGRGHHYVQLIDDDLDQHETWWWDRLEWSMLSSDDGGRRLGVDSDGIIFAATETTIDRWSGSEWVVEARTNGEEIREFIGHSDGIVVAGSFSAIGGVRSEGLARWAGDRWEAVGADANGDGVTGSVTGLAIGPDGNLLVGGALRAGGETDLRTAGTWDGENWTPAETGSPIEHLVTTSDGQVIAATDDGFYRRDGSAWQLLSPPLIGGGLKRVVADGIGGIVATGSFSAIPNGSPAVGIARWSGSEWSAIGEPISEFFIGDQVAADATGRVFVIGSPFPYNAWFWDGTGWSDRGPLYQDGVRDVVFDSDGSLVAAGSLDQPDIGRGPWVGRLDGTVWTSVGPSHDAIGNPLSIQNGLCGELLLLANDKLVRRQADGSWHTVVEVAGATDFVQRGSDIFFIGGSIRVAGHPIQTGLAQWTGSGLVQIATASSVEELVGGCDYAPATHGDVLRLYQAFFRRDPDVDGAKYWIELNETGQTLDQIADYFILGEEFANQYEGTTDGEFLTVVYRNVLGRNFDQAGFDYWLELLESGELTRGGVVRWVAANSEFVSQHPYLP